MWPVSDRAMTVLLTDLKDRGLLDDTLVIWMGEFSRTEVQVCATIIYVGLTRRSTFKSTPGMPRGADTLRHVYG